MPRGDGTGPGGMGPMTGRAAGYCAGYSVPGFMNPVGGRGFGGWGRGRGGGGGRGWGRGSQMMGAPGWGVNYAGVPPQPMPAQELEALKNQAAYMKNSLDEINERMKEVEAAEKKV